MADQEIILTPEGYQELLDELEWRRGDKAKEITEAIRRAKDFGDLSENAEYDAAREDQATNEARIKEINNLIANAKVVEVGAQDLSTVSIGCSVTVKPPKGKDATYFIVGTTETKSLENKISNESPLGRALIGHKVGDKVEVDTPSGKKVTYAIKAIGR